MVESFRSTRLGKSGAVASTDSSWMEATDAFASGKSAEIECIDAVLIDWELKLESFPLQLSEHSRHFLLQVPFADTNIIGLL